MTFDYNLSGYGRCRHWRQPVRVSRYQVTCSGILDKHGAQLQPYPDFGVYLSVQWSELLSRFWTNGSYLKALAELRLYPALVIDWRDMGGLPAEQMDVLVRVCWNKMRAGKSVDLGCAAGHGRTGTLLACLIGRLEHLDYREAIAQARSRYCSHAVETQSQEQTVKEYLQRFGVGKSRQSFLSKPFRRR